ncbi:hypothetical protein GF318_00685 [Candidatus Micrarchaeota archaeon]|nr:hypothetical protein [Candidatus Micrarchaeota archaeon]
MLLIEYLEDAAEKIRSLTMKLRKLDRHYRRCYDRDVRREMGIVKKEIKKLKSEVKYELLLNLEEFRYLDKYFPELLKTFMEDEYIGPVLEKKSWLLHYKSIPPREAAMRLEQVKRWRLQLREATKTLNEWVGTVRSRAFVATFPVLRGHMKGEMEKDEVREIIRKVDKLLLKEGWLLLISDSLIKIPISKYMNKIQLLKSQEIYAVADLRKAKGKGTVKETRALRRLEKIRKRKHHYENMLKQILLSNPSYLRSLKRKKNWLSREQRGAFDKFIEGLTPHKVKEMAWLDEMKKKLKIEEE